MIRHTILPAAAVIALLTGIAWAATWRIVPEKSRLTFTGIQTGNRFEGSFERFTADIRFDQADLGSSKAVVIIDMASARTGNAERDIALQGADWFAVARHPQGRFETTAFRHLGNGRFQADALLTIRDVTRPVALPFTLQQAAGETRAVGEIVISRADFGVGQGQWASPQWIAHEVTVSFDLLARPSP